MIFLLTLVAAFFVGSIPFGLLLGLSQGKDIRKEGSGNIGATNVWRLLGPKWGSLAFGLDVLKGLAVPAVVNAIGLRPEFGISTADLATASGVASIAGHMLNPWLGLKGGKGIATGLGALLGSAPLVGICGFGVWLVAMVFCRMVSLSSLIAVIGVLSFAVLFKQTVFFLVIYSLLGAYVWYKHMPNIQRILRGEESKFSVKGSAASGDISKGDSRRSEPSDPAAPTKD